MNLYRTVRKWQRLYFNKLPLLLFVVTWAGVLLWHAPLPVIAQLADNSAGSPQQLLPNNQGNTMTFPAIRGIWITSNDTKILLDRPQLQNALSQLAQLNLNTIYPVIWNSGYVLYPSLVAQRSGIQPFVRRGLQGYDPLTELISEAHQKHFLVIPWFEFGFMAPPLSELVLNHPNWLTQRRDGSQTSISAAGEVAWLNPFHPEVQQFIIDLVLEMMNQYDIDGIQFDDHTSLPNDFGYDDFTVKLYQAETKKTPHPDPQNPEWVRWRADKITTFMTRLNQAVKAQKPEVIISISPVPYDYAYKAQLQDWLTWVQKDLVDELIVQTYQSELTSFVERISRTEMQIAQQKIPTGVGILTGLRNRPTPIGLVQAKVQAAHNRGLGVSFFYYESLLNLAAESPTERRTVLQRLFPSPVPRSRVGQNMTIPTSDTSRQLVQ